MQEIRLTVGLQHTSATDRDVDLSSFPVEFKVRKESDLTIIAFVANQRLLEADLVSSLDLDIPHFEFLCTKSNPSFSVNKSAIQLFCALAQPRDDKLNYLKSQIDSSTESTPLIVTGHALGGPIASLFTLWLFDTVGLGKKRPLCITFGSPLIGDQNLQEAISRSPTWNSCFLHLASFQDPIPRSFISHNTYKPFGTFLLCFEYSASCFEDPDHILDLLMVMGSSMHGAHQELQPHHYKEVVDRLNRMAICKDISARAENMEYSSSLHASDIVQLQGLGIAQIQFGQCLHQNIDMNGLINKMGQQKRRTSIPPRKLDQKKINMATDYRRSFKPLDIAKYCDIENQAHHYKNALEHLNCMAIFKDFSARGENMNQRSMNVLMKSSAPKLQNEESHGLSLLDLPKQILDFILERLSPVDLFAMAKVCRPLRHQCRSDYLWEKHIEQKWSGVFSDVAHREWQGHATRIKSGDPLLQQSESGSFGSSCGDWPPAYLGSYLKNCRQLTGLIGSDCFNMALYVSLGSGWLWFPAQVYKSGQRYCYNALVSYDCNTKTFRASSPTCRKLIEQNIQWDRLRISPVEISPYDFYKSDCWNDLKPGDHIEIQRRSRQDLPYDWCYGVVGHLESCNGDANLCHCQYSGKLIIEFKQFHAESSRRRFELERNVREEQVGNFYRYGGIRKLDKVDEIERWNNLRATRG